MAGSVIRGIVATDPRLAIGRGGTLPWHYPEDLRFFKETTLGHLVLMGRRTFESIGRPLPGRENVVLTRSGFHHPGVRCIRAVGEVERLLAAGDRDLFVIGGAQVYEAMAPLIDEWIVTRIPEVAEGADTFLPATLFDGFSIISQRELGSGLVVEYWRRAV
jgi:dihydrofolate reductase